MKDASGFNGLLENDDVEAVRYYVHRYPSGRAYWALYFADQVQVGAIVPVEDDDSRALAVRYLQRVADQALALIAEIGAVAAAAAAEEEADGAPDAA